MPLQGFNFCYQSHDLQLDDEFSLHTQVLVGQRLIHLFLGVSHL